MSTTEDTASLQLADYGSLLRRRWWIVAAGLLVGLLVGFAAMKIIPPDYEASASVLVLPTDIPGQSGNVAGGRTSDAVNLDTESQLVTSAAVADDAKKLLKSDESAGDLAERVTVTVPANSSVLTIGYADSSPAKAAKGAHYFAQSYLANRKTSAEKQGAALEKTLTSQQDALQKRLKKTSSRVAELPANSSDREVATAQQSVLTNQISDIANKLAPLEDLFVDPGRIITDAVPPTSPSQPVPVLFLVSGAMLGLLGGLLAAVLRDRGDHSIRRAKDVTKLLDLPVLADVDLPARPGSWTGLLPSKSGAAQEIRQLQHAISGPQDQHPRVVLLTAASRGPAAGLVAANLTATLGRSGKRVVHVCADLGTFRSATMLGVQPGAGLAEVLLGERSVDYVIQQAPGNRHVHVIAPGLRPSEVGDALPTDDLGAIVTVLRDQFDYVVLETPATTLTADAQAWAQFSDVAVIAAQRLHTLREDALDAVSQMERVGCDVLGFAVLPMHPKNDDDSTQAPHSAPIVYSAGPGVVESADPQPGGHRPQPVAPGFGPPAGGVGSRHPGVPGPAADPAPQAGDGAPGGEGSTLRIDTARSAAQDPRASVGVYGQRNG